jgi:uncharacterized protein
MLMTHLDSLIKEYDNFDPGHSRKHANAVLEKSLEIARDLNVERLDIVACVAIYHDLGLRYGRENHEMNSAKIVKNDKYLKTMMSKKDINIIAEAVEDHRASSKKEPRSIYGKIVSDADREYDFDIIIIRCIHYRHDMEFDDLFVETRKHILDKYAKGGYLPPFYYRKKDKEVEFKLNKFAEDEVFAISEFKRIWDSLKK